MSVVGWAGALAPTQAAEERKKLEEKREDRKQLEAIIQGEIAALDEELFARLDVGGKGFLTPDDLKHLATASGEEWDELVIDSMPAGVSPPTIVPASSTSSVASIGTRSAGVPVPALRSVSTNPFSPAMLRADAANDGSEQ